MADDDKEKTYSIDEFVGGIRGETGARMDLNIVVSADLHVEVRSSAGHEAAGGLAYSARGPSGKTWSGTTDADGRFLHSEIPAGEYEVTMDDLSFKVPTVKGGHAPVVRWISKHSRSK
jgi:hypothetical protein